MWDPPRINVDAMGRDDRHLGHVFRGLGGSRFRVRDGLGLEALRLLAPVSGLWPVTPLSSTTYLILSARPLRYAISNQCRMRRED